MATTDPTPTPTPLPALLARIRDEREGHGHVLAAYTAAADEHGDYSRRDEVAADVGAWALDALDTLLAALPTVPDLAPLRAEFDAALAALRTAGVAHDADHPTAARYRAASDAVNHAARKSEAAGLALLTAPAQPVTPEPATGRTFTEDDVNLALNSACDFLGGYIDGDERETDLLNAMVNASLYALTEDDDLDPTALAETYYSDRHALSWLTGEDDADEDEDEDDDELRPFTVLSDAGKRVWQAADSDHALDQHNDAHPDETAILVTDQPEYVIADDVPTAPPA